MATLPQSSVGQMDREIQTRPPAERQSQLPKYLLLRVCTTIIVNSSPHSAAYTCMCRWIGSAPLQIMASRLFGTKPISEQRFCYYTPRTTKLLGVYWFHPVRLSVRPSVRLSRLPCPLCNIYSSRWILSILLATNDHYHERVCRTQWLWPISSRSFGLDLENRVRSVESTALDGFFLYLAQMITLIRGCVACYVFFQNLEIRIFGKF